MIVAVREFLFKNLGKDFIDMNEDLSGLNDCQIGQKIERWREIISHKKHLIWEEITHSYFKIKY